MRAQADELAAMRAENADLKRSLQAAIAEVREQVVGVSADVAHLRDSTSVLGQMGTDIQTLDARVKDDGRDRQVGCRLTLLSRC